MNRMRKAAALAMIAIACFSCKRSHSVSKGERFVPANDPAIHYFGRLDQSDPLKPKASWPGFGFTTVFQGASLHLRMRDKDNYYNVEVDGKLTGVIGGRRDRSTDYLLASGLPDGPHVIRVQRRNISFDDPTEIEGLVVDAGAVLSSPPVHSGPVIEIIGDSFTAAEGNEASAPSLSWNEKASLTNFDRGFAVHIARHYNAQLIPVCRSGVGLISDYQGKRDHPMTERYLWSLMEDSKPNWNFPKPSADLVIICLGINDFSGMKNPQDEIQKADTAAFVEAYHRLISLVRHHHPGSRIIAVAADIPWLRQSIHKVVTDENASGHSEVGYAQFDRLPGNYVADGHPDAETHKRIADQLLLQIGPLTSRTEGLE